MSDSHTTGTAVTQSTDKAEIKHIMDKNKEMKTREEDSRERIQASQETKPSSPDKC
jgi:hypothetical protein